MQKTIFIFALSFFVVPCIFSQSFYVEPLDTLNAHVTRAHDLETIEALNNFKHLRDYKWLHLIPTVGYDTRWKTPTVSVSSSQYVNYFQRKDEKKYRMLILEQQAEKDIDITLFRLKGYYTRLIRQLNELDTRHQIMIINQKLYEIEEEKYKNIDIDTEEFLRSQRSYLSQLSDFQAFKVSIFQTISDIENIIKRALVVDAPLL